MGVELCACKFTYSSLSFGSALKPFKRNRKAVAFAVGDVGKVWGFVSVKNNAVRIRFYGIEEGKKA